MKRRVVPFLLALCLVVGMVPSVAYADDPDISITELENGEFGNRTEYTGSDSEDASGNHWSYDAATKTLTLNNFRGSVFVYCSRVILIGENILSAFSCSAPRQGQFSSPIIEGSGSMTFRGGTYGVSYVLDDCLQMTGGSSEKDNMPLKIEDRKIVKPDGTVASFVRIESTGDAPLSETGKFTDVPYSAWYYDAVEYATKPVYEGYDYGLMDSATTTSFSPNANADRATIVTALCRRFNFDIEKNPSYRKIFSDVPEELGSVVYWAVTNDIVTGYGDGTFGPYDPVTREQFAVMLYRYIEHKDGWRDLTPRADLSSYTDSGQISSWAKDAMSWANASDYITGKTNATLDPKGNITRAEVAMVFMRLM